MNKQRGAASFFTLFASIIGFILVLMALSWVFRANDWAMYKFWAPKEEQVRRETYEQSKSYRQGNIQRLGTLCTQVSQSQDKTLLNGVIRHEFAEWDASDVPSHLQSCLSAARGR